MKKITLFLMAIAATLTVQTVVAQGGGNPPPGPRGNPGSSPNKSDHHVPPGKPPKPPKPPKNKSNQGTHSIVITPALPKTTLPIKPVSTPAVKADWPAVPALPTPPVKVGKS